MSVLRAHDLKLKILYQRLGFALIVSSSPETELLLNITESSFNRVFSLLY